MPCWEDGLPIPLGRRAHQTCLHLYDRLNSTKLMEDPFDSILHYENSIYHEAYALGQRDGTRAGLIEGRLFGLEKGFDKFLEMGRLHGRALVWASRLPSKASLQTAGRDGAHDDDNNEKGQTAPPVNGADSDAEPAKMLPPLRVHGRLEKHIQALLELTDPARLATANDDEAVAAFDARFQRAVHKARIVGRIVGEDPGVSPAEAGEHGNAQDVGAGEDEGNIEDINVRQLQRRKA